MLALIASIVTIAAFVLTLAIIFYERRRSPECEIGKPLRARKKQRTIAFWTIGRFYQAIQQFDLYCEELEGGNLPAEQKDPSMPSREDLLRFAQAVLLTAAVDIVPFSQGKANLFHFADQPGGGNRQIVSHVLNGPFPPTQVLSGANAYRTMSITDGRKADSVAGECVRIGLPRLERLTEKGGFSGEEIELGTTHILGIPVKFKVMNPAIDYRFAPESLPAAITIDLRIMLMRPLLPLIRRFTYRRSQFICHRLSRYNDLVRANP
jgi:hypothetical protein